MATKEEADVTASQPQPGNECMPMKPAILGYASTDFLSIVICGYIGGRHLLVKVQLLEPWGVAWLVAGVISALVTSFGGGAFYSLLMKRPGSRSFGWQDPFAVFLVICGYILSLLLARPSCSCLLNDFEAAGFVGLGCGEALRLIDCLNCAILITWGASKSLSDAGASGKIARVAWSLVATYAYSFGGGIVRDTTSILLGVDIAVGNFSSMVVLPALLGTLLIHCLLVLRCSSLVQLGVGLPAVGYIFYLVPDLLP